MDGVEKAMASVMLLKVCVKAEVLHHSGVGGVGHLWPPSPHTGYALEW